jgi:hypothetical protein
MLRLALACSCNLSTDLEGDLAGELHAASDNYHVTEIRHLYLTDTSEIIDLQSFNFHGFLPSAQLFIE